MRMRTSPTFIIAIRIRKRRDDGADGRTIARPGA